VPLQPRSSRGWYESWYRRGAARAIEIDSDEGEISRRHLNLLGFRASLEGIDAAAHLLAESASGLSTPESLLLAALPGTQRAARTDHKARAAHARSLGSAARVQ
jgi:membrane carboxypeptidase/penicillin-binding protein PbpC